MRNLTNFSDKHENEVEAQRSEKLPIKQKCQSLLLDSVESIAQGIKIPQRTTGGSKQTLTLLVLE